MTKTPEEAWVSVVPSGEMGNAKVMQFEVDDMGAALHNATCPFNHDIKPGTYTKLTIDGRTMMSDTPKEFYDHIELFNAAHGDVLVHGLGLGCALSVLLTLADRVDSITVIEVNPNVIALVAGTFSEHIESGRLRIIEDDAFEWGPDKRYDSVWSDIWFDLNPDNLPEMDALREKYKDKCSWHGCWSEHEIRSANSFSFVIA